MLSLKNINVYFLAIKTHSKNFIKDIFFKSDLYNSKIIEKGERQTSPTIFLTTVNEDFSSIEVFSIDTATEFLWALAAVVGCFSMVLIPSFGLYFASRAKERNNELKLKLAEESVEKELEQE